MENAAYALKMAAAALIFIIAIASSFSLFGTAKQTADSIIGMRDKQAYLEAAELEGTLYISSNEIQKEGGKYNTKFTKEGDRIVNFADVISTIYRYVVENYAVTIIKMNGTTGTVIARYDTDTESYIQDYKKYGREFFENYQEIVSKNIKTKYCTSIKFNNDKIEDLYKINIDSYIYSYGAPWIGDTTYSNIKARINADISGSQFTMYKETEAPQTYTGKNLLQYKDNKFIEVTNEIDKSKYLSNLLQQYQMPTVEIIYIIQ